MGKIAVGDSFEYCAIIRCSGRVERCSWPDKRQHDEYDTVELSPASLHLGKTALILIAG